jgi:hypothetical protein
MSRIGISDDEEFPGQFGLWQGNCQRSIKGRVGQAALRELEAALLALPQKRLIAGELEDSEGEVCALGALKRYKGVAEVKAEPEWEMEEVGVELGMPRLVAWKVVALNDDEFDWRAPISPEERYEKVLTWVRKQLIEPSQPAAA